MKNRLFVVGIGPGDADQMTLEARDILHSCEVIVGYTVYVDLIKPFYPDKQYVTTGMKQELERCRLALQTAQMGRRTAVICSGDAGVYGLAGILLELSQDYQTVEIQVIAGVTAALSGGAVLGAPLGHDFAVISLSDLLTPWEMIAKRLLCAARSDLAVCLYNPSSRKRKDYLKKACDIMLRYRSGDTVCGYVHNIGRIGEQAEIVSLTELSETSVDMFTTVFVGNSQTKRIGDHMVTPRGYQRKEELWQES
ncbi:MAG: precorrin-3B C(17)-methyltransferase [Lachnospiraceae bacterium]